MVNMDTNLSF